MNINGVFPFCAFLGSAASLESTLAIASIFLCTYLANGSYSSQYGFVETSAVLSLLVDVL